MKIKSYFVKILIKTVLISSILLLASCGGGTVGTGGESAISLNRVEGKVTNQSNIPISGLTVFIDGNSTVTVTDGAGNFSIDIDNQDALLVDLDSGQATFDIIVSATVDGQDDTLDFAFPVSVDATQSLANVDVELDIPDDLIQALEMVQVSPDAQSLIEEGLSGLSEEDLENLAEIGLAGL